MTDIFAAIQAVTTSGEGWRLVQGVMMTLTTLGVGWTAKTVFHLRDDVRELKSCVGTDGKNGLQTAVAEINSRVRHIEERHAAIDAVAEAERNGYEGPERRYQVRRQRDSLLPPMPAFNPEAP